MHLTMDSISTSMSALLLEGAMSWPGMIGQTLAWVAAGDWDPKLFKSRASMDRSDADWGELGVDDRELQMVGFSGRVRANAAAAVPAQDRQASYMYILPPDSPSSRDTPEVRHDSACKVSLTALVIVTFCHTLQC